MTIKSTYVIRNAKVEWVKTIKPETTFSGKEVYSANVAVTDADIKALESLGITEQVMNPSEGTKQSRYRNSETLGKFLKLQVNATTATGEKKNGPLVLDRNKQPHTGLIGNGSTANVTVLINESKKMVGKKELTNTAPKLGDIQIVELVEYVGKGGPSGTRGSQFEDLDMASDSDVAANIARLQNS